VYKRQAFRDIYGNKSRLFRDDSWNLDHLVFDWLEIHGVEKIYYYEKKSGNLFRITTGEIRRAIKREEAYTEKLNNHTQIFLPRYLWATNPKEKKDVLDASRRWVKEEVDVGWMQTTFDRIREKENRFYISPEVKMRLKEIWERKIVNS